MKKFLLLLSLLSTTVSIAQQEELPLDSNAIATNSFGENWFSQFGVDMSLQNPYGTNFKNVFPNGKSFGIDIAIGKWLTPEFGLRGKINWEGGIIKSDHATWLHTDNGYLIFTSDFLINMNNLFSDYNPDKKWNIYVYPRTGALINLKKETVIGSPMLGFGVGGTYRLNKKWSIYSDLAYQVTTSAIGNRTGQGTGNNGYFDINLGVQLDLGNNRFYRVSEKTDPGKNDVMTNSFWSNWFAQTGIGMSLLNVYGCNFAHVFPNGKTLGINLGIGKWFTPEFGLRGGINWQNGIIGNNHLEWLDAENQPGSNHDRGGFGAIYVDGFFNLHNIFGEYSETRKWNAIIFPRAGLDSNFETSSGSPLIGIGMEHTFYLNNRLKLYADLAYQVTSSEFVQMKYESNHKDGNSNGWFDINIGVQYELGKSKGRFRKITSRYTGE